MDTFLGFSSGPRTCLGKKFASVEAVCFLTLLLRDWKVDVKLEQGQSSEDWEKKAMFPTLGTSLKTCKLTLLDSYCRPVSDCARAADVPLVMTKREKA